MGAFTLRADVYIVGRMRRSKSRVRMERRKHWVLFPFPEQGHVTPMLQLALHLASSGISVTVINTSRIHAKLPSPAHTPPLIRFASIPDGLPQEYSSDVIMAPSVHGQIPGSSAMPALLRSLPEQAPHLEKLLLQLAMADEQPPSCFVADSFCHWTESTVRKLGMAWMAFWSSSATRLCLTVRAMEEQSGDDEMATAIPGLPCLRKPVAVFSFRQNQTKLPVGLLLGRTEALFRADLVLCNTFAGIEHEAIEYLASRLRIRDIGPLCIGAEAAYRLGSLKEADEGCLAWLDRQVSRSVLYVSFGSKVTVGEEAMEKIAAAIEATGRPFLWVLKGGVSRSAAEAEAMEMAKRRGESNAKVVEWVEQEKVLGHSAIAAFLTHCGWNSVMEAVVEAVPLICWPVFADQPVNRALVEEKWRIGKGLDGQSEVADIKAAIEEVMGDKDMRRRAENLRQSAMDAVHSGGSSHQSFCSVISDSFGKNPPAI